MKIKFFVAKCPNCKYEWETKSKLDFITCPNCQKKFKKDYKHSLNTN
jgi:DNA-directed RNA polymerase subunit RPC12/RpoP